MSAQQPPARDALELVFLGTGTSSSLPHVACLTAPPDEPRCRACLSTLTPAGKKNIRRNTSAVLRVPARDGSGRTATIVVDVGKTFQAAAVEWFPKYGLRRIDAVLITHAHADAMNGLDDLRAWTLRSAIQPHVDLYVSQNTFMEVQRSFPYLVAKEFASGGGDVPEFKWHIIDDKVPFEIGDTGIQITPFYVHHGRVFSRPPTPVLSRSSTPSGDTSDGAVPDIKPLSLTAKPKPARNMNGASPTVTPYLCFAFKIQDDVVYMSDVSTIPDDAWPLLAPPADAAPLPVLVLDCLHLYPHTSHFGLAQAVETARRIGARKTFLTGFGHEIAHDEYGTILKAVESGALRASGDMTPVERAGIGLIREGRSVWMRSAFDGLRVIVDKDGEAVAEDCE